MSIVRGVYEGLTAITCSLILDVIMKVLLLMGFTNIVYDLLQLITAILWIGIGMFGWNNVCISSARLERPGAKAPRKAHNREDPRSNPTGPTMSFILV